MGKKINITVLEGDGIGPEVTKEAVKTLKSVAEVFGHNFQFQHEDFGGVAIDKHGASLPERTLSACKNSDTVLLGAIGDPKFDNKDIRPEQGLLALRQELDLFANLRPVRSYPSLVKHSPLKSEIIKDVDLLIVRELTGGIYFGERGRSKDGNAAYDTCSYSKIEIQRIVELAFTKAEKRRSKICLIDKANVLESSRLWREEFLNIQKNRSNVSCSFQYVDNAAMQIILNPSQYDVIVTSNMFGDIISDESSVIAGSLGLLPSASLGKMHSLFEPIHGSYPQAAGKNIANPMATILSAAMMLEHFDLLEEAAAVKNAVELCLHSNFVTKELTNGEAQSCSAVGKEISKIIKEKSKIS